MVKLLQGALPVDEAIEGQANIPEAAKATFVMSEVVVRLALDGQLTRKWQLTTERGYMSLLLDVAEVQAVTRGPDHGGLTGVQAAHRLWTTPRVVAALIKHGQLKTETVINPINRCPTVVVMPAELDRFDAEYVPLFVIAKQQGRAIKAVKRELTATGNLPAFDPEAIGATFYRRSDNFAARIPAAKKGSLR